jgi:mannose-6-phosphate isomerase-like protein (cupin superfamily)
MTNTAPQAPPTQQAQPFVYEKPSVGEGKGRVLLAHTDIGSVAVQVIKRGGENNLHHHVHRDGFWFVLRGRVRFYTTGDELLAELGPNEGMLTPRGFDYWFEAVPGEEELELLQFGATEVPLTPAESVLDRVNVEALKPNQSRSLER